MDAKKIMDVNFSNSIKQAIDIVKLKGKVIEKVSKDNNATLIGILIIAIAGILGGLGSTLYGTPDLAISTIILTSLFAPVFTVLIYFILVGIMHTLARLFGGKAKYIEYFRAESHAAILSWLGVLALIPLLGGIINLFISIWGFIVSVVVLENVHKLTRGKAIIVVLIPIIVMILLLVIGSATYFGAVNPETLL